MVVILKPRYARIAKLVTDGMGNKDIAREVGTTENVVKSYLTNIYDLTGMSSRLELALWYVKHYETEEP